MSAGGRGRPPHPPHASSPPPANPRVARPARWATLPTLPGRGRLGGGGRASRASWPTFATLLGSAGWGVRGRSAGPYNEGRACSTRVTTIPHPAVPVERASGRADPLLPAVGEQLVLPDRRPGLELVDEPGA